MSKRLSYFFRALSLATLLSVKIPQYISDGKITVDEMTDFIKQAMLIGGWKAHIAVPEDLIDATVDFELEEE